MRSINDNLYRRVIRLLDNSDKGKIILDKKVYSLLNALYNDWEYINKPN